jgi:hypothetical protein
LHVERAAERLATGSAVGAANQGTSEMWQQVARRLDFTNLNGGHPRDVRRAIAEIWKDESRPDEPAALMDHCVGAQRKSYDRAIILAYLRSFPTAHPLFDRLAQSAEQVADRHDWQWAERGRSWFLWQKDKGPETLARALLDGEAPTEILTAFGLDGDLAEGAFVTDSLDVACELVGSAQGEEAEALGEKLISVFKDLGLSEANSMLVFALLNPWVTDSPSQLYRRSTATLLVKRIGDPRLAPAAWGVVERDLKKRIPNANVLSMMGTLRRWLTSATVRAFFNIIRTTTDNPLQWAAREAFWLAYLDADLVTDAWFAFGRQAELKAGALARQEEVRYGRVVGGCDPSHSSLIMSIGDTRIAEWSHNGSCRFWRASNAKAPVPYKFEYDGNLLRTTYGGSDFAYIPHQGAWQGKFAKKIFDLTGIRHPKLGKGNFY